MVKEDDTSTSEDFKLFPAVITDPDFCSGYAPVCDPATGTAHGNGCKAVCDDVDPKSLIDGACEVRF